MKILVPHVCVKSKNTTALNAAIIPCFSINVIFKTILFSVLFILAFSAKSQSFIQDQNGNNLFLYDTLSRSLLEFPNYAKVREITTSGLIKDGTNTTTCNFNSSNGEFRDLNNDLIGKLNTDGTITDINGDLLGTIQSNGQILSISGSLIILFTPGVPLPLLVYQFFLGGF